MEKYERNLFTNRLIGKCFHNASRQNKNEDNSNINLTQFDQIIIMIIVKFKLTEEKIPRHKIAKMAHKSCAGTSSDK
jgi:hypothetical protein